MADRSGGGAHLPLGHLEQQLIVYLRQQPRRGGACTSGA